MDTLQVMTTGDLRATVSQKRLSDVGNGSQPLLVTSERDLLVRASEVVAHLGSLADEPNVDALFSLFCHPVVGLFPGTEGHFRDGLVLAAFRPFRTGLWPFKPNLGAA